MNTLDLDSLKEVASIGAGHSATALSKLIKQSVNVDIPDIKIVSVENVPELLGEKEKVVTLVMVKLTEDLKGVVLYIFNPQTAVELARLFTSDESMYESALKEMMNILLGSGLSSVGEFLETRIIHTVPMKATDMLGAVVDPVLAELGQKTDNVLMLNMTYQTGNNSFQCVFLTDPPSTKLILEKIQKFKSNNGTTG